MMSETPGAKMKYRLRKTIWFLMVLFLSFSFISIRQMQSGVFSGKEVSPDHRFLIEYYELSQTGRYSDNSSTFLFKVFALEPGNESEHTLLQSTIRKVYNGAWLKLWDCENELNNCRSFIFSSGDGETSLALPPNTLDYLHSFVPWL